MLINCDTDYVHMYICIRLTYSHRSESIE